VSFEIEPVPTTLEFKRYEKSVGTKPLSNFCGIFSAREWSLIAFVGIGIIILIQWLGFENDELLSANFAQ
jgi:hypothetical protein